MLLHKENLLGQVKLVKLAGKKFGLPFPASIDHSWNITINDFFAESIPTQNAILISPHKCGRFLRTSISINKRRNCFEIPNEMIRAMFSNSDATGSCFEVYHCFEGIVNSSFTLKNAQSDTFPQLEFNYFDGAFTLEKLDEILAFDKGIDIKVNVCSRIDCLLYCMSMYL